VRFEGTTRSLRRTWVPSARSAFPRPPGYRETGGSSGFLRATPSVRLPIPCRGLSQHPRTVPAARRRPRQTMLPPLGFLAPRHMPERRSVSAGRPAPKRAARGLGTSCATMTSVPAERPFGPPSVLGLLPSRRSPRAGRTPSREPLPSCRCPRRFASPLKERADAAGFRASIPAASSFCRRTLAGTTRRCLPGLRPSRAFSPAVLASAFGSRPLPHHALGGTDVPNRLRLEVLRSGGVGWPLSGLPALLGFLTLRPSRHRKDRAEGGLMDSPHGSRRVRASNRSLPSRDRPEPRGEPRPDAAVHR